MSEFVSVAELTLDDLRDGKAYTPKQIAEALQTKPKRIAAAFRKGELAGIELGPKTIRITGRAVREWLTTKSSSMNSESSADRAEISPMDNGVSMSSKRAKSVGDLALASL